LSLELTHQAHLADQPDDFMQAAEMRFQLIQEMSIDTEFSVLAANVELARRSLAHGLPMRIRMAKSPFSYLITHAQQLQKLRGSLRA
jgi:hypothetical protein